MSEPAPSIVTGNDAGGGQEGLTPDRVEALLADFRTWLLKAPPPEPPLASEAPPDLHTLLGQLIALRQEVNLQTKATRAQQEQQAETLRQLTEALAALEDERAQAQEAAEEQQDDILRPLLKTLVELADALALGRREMLKVQETLAPVLDQLTQPFNLAPAPPTPPARPRVTQRVSVDMLFGRLFGFKSPSKPGPDPDAAWRAIVEHQERQLQVLGNRLTQRQQTAERVRQAIAALLAGYTMGYQRVERALQHHDLEPIVCVGLPFDPESMEVVDVVTEPGRQGTEVLEEVRRGYLWRNRVFRFAQVRVARP